MNDTTVHVGTGKSGAGWRRFSRRQILVAAVCLVGVVVLGVLIVKIDSAYNKSRKTKANLQAAVNQSQASFAKGNYEASYRTLQVAADKATSKDEKVQVYGNLASAAASAGHINDAINYMNQKHQVDPSTAGPDAYQLGTFYEQVGQKDKAIEQYQLAISYLKAHPQMIMSGADATSLQERIDALKKG